MTVRLTDPEPNGLASIVADLLRANLEREPGRSRLLGPDASFTISAPDIALATTVRFGQGDVEITNGGDAAAAVKVRADARTLLELSSVPLRLGFPDAFRPAGREILGKLRSKQLRVRGLLRHPVMVSRLNRLLAVD